MELEYPLVPSPLDRLSTSGAQPLSLVQRAGLRFLSAAVAHWKGESIALSLPDGSVRLLGDRSVRPVHRMEILDGAIFRRLLLRADLGLGEGFTAGEWTTPDLPALLGAFVRQVEKYDRFWNPVFRVADRIRHRLNANTLSGSERNIRAHYDLGNDFYRAWLDPSMQYSAGIYPSAQASLEEAQDLKLRTLIGKLSVVPGMHVLEIGSGWGELAVRLVRDHGCRVTTVTLSQEQHAWVVERAARLGLSDRLEARLQDYREVGGVFDRVVSVEMIEAVGHENLPVYFGRIDSLLAPGGVAVVQAITTPDSNYHAYRKRIDWIQAHIFPGAICPSVSAMMDAIARGSRLALRHLEDIGPHYARDLANWRDRFLAAWPRLQAMGFDDRFRRMWTYYLGYCEAGFAQRKLGDVQMVLARSGEFAPSAIPARATAGTAS